MIEQIGDIWEFYYEAQWIVITTNIGYKKNGSNPMGAGIALQASEMYPDLPKWYGERCKKFGANTAVTNYDPARFFLFPTKPLNEEKPWMSWQGRSTIELITRSAKQLAALVDLLSQRKTYLFIKIGLPMVGCENGGLESREVLPILHRFLDDRFILFHRQSKLHWLSDNKSDQLQSP